MIIDKIRREIARYDKPENRLNYQRFFKEKLKEPYGLKTSIIRKISNDCFKEVKHLARDEILGYSDKLLESDERYFRVIAFEWAHKVRKQYVRGDLKRFESWLKKYVDNWGSCDHLSGNVLGEIITQYPDLVVKTMKWTKSTNRWVKRAAAVSLIVPVRRGLLLDKVFQTADTLLTDTDDMVQKGYGWMLKEASHQFPEEVFNYVMEHKKVMPRTALRYAIEKLPPNKRREAMKKD
jgi:3-methyladenine DNA glycosylase AlkD